MQFMGFGGFICWFDRGEIVMARFSAPLLISLLLVACPALSQEDEPDSLAVEPVQIQTILPSGMQVLIKSLPDAALTRVGMFYAAGSALEPDSLAGLAHLSEHLLTESSLNYPDGELIRQQTLYSTYRNAYTGSAYMQFDTECLPVFLPRILELEADRQRSVVTDPVSFARERSVVLEELAMRQRLTPPQVFTEKVFHACYPGHPFGRSVGGTAESVSRIGIDDFLEFQNTFIRPERSALVVMGPLDPEQALVEIERIFLSNQKVPTVFAETPPFPPITAGQLVVDSDDHTGLMTCLAFRVSLQEDRDAALAAVLPNLMQESGLYPRASSVPGETIFMLVGRSSYYRPSTNSEDHWGTIYPEFDPEQQSLRFLGNKWDNISNFVNELMAPDVFAKRLAQAIDDLDSPSLNPGRSTGRGTALVNGNEFMTKKRIHEILEDAQPDDFLQFMERWFNHDQVIVGVSHGRDSERQATVTMAKSKPKPSGEGADSALESLTSQQVEPVLKEYGKAGLIKMERLTLSNGTPVVNLLMADSRKFTLAGLRTFEGIKDMRPGKKPGITQIFNLVVDFDDRQRRDPDRDLPPRPLPHDLHFRLSWNTAGLHAAGPADQMAKILATVQKRISSRDFNSLRWYSVTRWGDKYLQDMLERKINMATAWRWEQILGPEHPSLGQWAPDPEAFAKVNYKDLSNLHKNTFQKTGNLQLMAAGTVPADQVRKHLDRTFGQHDTWKARKQADPPEVKVQGIRGKIVADLTRGDVVLTFSFPPCPARQGRRPVTAALTLKTALDQVLTSRLREKEGLTYGVAARINPVAGGLLWEASVTCQPGQPQIVFPLVREELARLVGTGFSDDEIARARLQLTGTTIGNLSDAESGLDYLQWMARLGEIPLDPLREIFLVSRDEVNDLARSAIDPYNFVFTATGPMFEEDLELFDLP